MFHVRFFHVAVAPLTAQIITKTQPLQADTEFKVACESAGSRPPAVITWYKGSQAVMKKPNVS